MNSFSQYFHEFFTPTEKALFMRELNYGGKFYTYINSAEIDWDIATTRFKQLLPYGNIDSFYVEINKNATSIIIESDNGTSVTVELICQFTVQNGNNCRSAD